MNETKRARPERSHTTPTPRGSTKGRGSSEFREHSALHSLGVDFDAREYLESKIGAIVDFPVPGIVFRDITPLLADPRAFHIALDALTHHFIGEKIDAVVGVESRGFIFGGALAARLNASFVPVRKPGKLPGRTDRVSYSLEYGESELEMHRDALHRHARVVVVDDLLATGGTAAAAAELVERQEAKVVGFAFVIELLGLGGRERLGATRIISLLNFEG